MITNNINNFGSNRNISPATTQAVPMPEGTKIASRQIFVWISQPGIGSHLDLSEISTPAEFSEQYFKSFGAVADPLSSTAELNSKMVQIAGDVTAAAGKQILITNIMFQNFSVQSSNATVQQIINDSLSSPNAAYPQARFNQSPMAGWAENYFRPRFSVGGSDIFAGLGTLKTSMSSVSSELMPWMRSIGLALPFALDPNVYGSFAGNIDVYGNCFMPVKQADNSYLYQQMPIWCVAEVVY